jgi:hypothetical protein
LVTGLRHQRAPWIVDAVEFDLEGEIESRLRDLAGVGMFEA